MCIRDRRRASRSRRCGRMRGMPTNKKQEAPLLLVYLIVGEDAVSYTHLDVYKRQGVSRAMADQVVVLAEQAKRAGISGVVASPQEAARLREILGPDAYIVTPGVRPAGAAKGDQSRVATPAEAFANGASHIVVGRPITQADDPAAAFEAIAAEL